MSQGSKILLREILNIIRHFGLLEYNISEIDGYNANEKDPVSNF